MTVFCALQQFAALHQKIQRRLTKSAEFPLAKRAGL
jgi:hypothetical protein